ncbi:MAG: hypothetical protein PUC06_03090 [Oscillospiraceae bacterium]|nr:hypothetical protein [Oscillospiraceae bacterium]
MKKEKTRFALWIDEETLKQVQEHYSSDGCRTQSEFIARAIRFYCGYLTAKKAGDYLPGTIASTLEGVLLMFGDRLGRLLFRLVVEVGMMGRIIASDTAMDSETIERLRAECVRDAKKTNGQISFRDALRFCDLDM